MEVSTGTAIVLMAIAGVLILVNFLLLARRHFCNWWNLRQRRKNWRSEEYRRAWMKNYIEETKEL